MGCNCKKGDSNNEKVNNVSLGKKITSYSVKFIGFLLLLVLLPIINIALIVFMFKTLVLNEQVDLKSLLMFIGKKGKANTEDDDDDYDDDEYDYLTEDDVVMVDYDDITIKK
jgi:hypothetical protein